MLLSGYVLHKFFGLFFDSVLLELLVFLSDPVLLTFLILC